MKHPIRDLWLILAISFILLIVASASSGVKIFGYELRTTDIYSEIVGCSEALVLEPVQIDSIRHDTVEVVTPKFPATPDTTAKSILLIGDSMLEGISPRLAAYASLNGHSLNTVIWYSSTSEVWGSCDTLSYFIRKFKPNYIFVCLGANELFVKNIISRRAKYLHRIMSQIGSIPYVWIGPPNWKQDTGINELLDTELPEGCFFRSEGMTFDRSSDGAHPTRHSASLWVDSIARWMPEHALHPISMNSPCDSVGRPNRVVVLQPKK